MTGVAYNFRDGILNLTYLNHRYSISTNGTEWNDFELPGSALRNIIYDDYFDCFFIVGSAIYGSYFADRENKIDMITEESDMSLNLIKGDNVIRFTSDNGIGNIILSYKQKYLGV